MTVAIDVVGVSNLRAAAVPMWGLGRGVGPEAAGVRALSTDMLLTALDQIDSGVLVLDLGAQVLMANDAARLELTSGGVLCISDDGGLGVQDPPDQLVLRAALLSAAKEGRHQLLSLHVGEQTLSLSVQPLCSPGKANHAMVLLGRRQVCPSLVVEMLGSQYSLTLAERRVLVGLIQGARVADIAREHGVKVSTVRSQVSTLRSKLKVRRIDDLIRLAAELPPMAPAWRGHLARQAQPEMRIVAHAVPQLG